jgi:ketosteroid isomerase-like protein
MVQGEKMTDQKMEIGPAISSDLIRLAVAYNDALDRCTVTKGSNIDEVMEFFADDAIRVTVGQDPAVGKPAIRESFLRRSGRLQQVVELKGIELWGDFIVCRIERKDTTHTASGLEHHLRILLVKEGKIKRLIVVVDPEEDGRLKPIVPD